MKIGIISHPPAWTTGFGTTTYKIATGLSKFGYEVTCLGLGFGIEADEKLNEAYPFNIWKGNTSRNKFDVIKAFLNDINADVILINFDIRTAVYLIKIYQSLHMKIKIFAYVAIDGFPVAAPLLECINEIDGVIVPTKASQKHLRSQAVKKVYYAPHGVDVAEFFPLDKQEVRTKLRLISSKRNAFVIGLFAKNNERKQLPKVFLALQYLIFNLKQKNIFLYVHSEIKPNAEHGWDLKALANHLKITDHVIFTEKGFVPEAGVQKNISGHSKSLSYLERINMCDVVVNVPFSGGFELCNIEAQACGVPLITINDYGNIKEVVGESALLIEPKIKNIWSTGAIVYLIDEADLAEGILQIKNDIDLRKSLQQKGFENIKRFPWSHVQRVIKKMFAKA